LTHSCLSINIRALPYQIGRVATHTVPRWQPGQRIAPHPVSYTRPRRYTSQQHTLHSLQHYSHYPSFTAEINFPNILRLHNIGVVCHHGRSCVRFHTWTSHHITSHHRTTFHGTNSIKIISTTATAVQSIHNRSITMCHHNNQYNNVSPIAISITMSHP
jgi:hypothetical protein